MKKILILLLTVAALFPLSAQDVLVDETEIEVQEDSLYFLKNTTISDNGTAYPDTAITRTLLGDSLAASFYVFRTAVEEQQQMSAWLGRALQRNTSIASFNELNDLFQQVTGENLQGEVGREYQNVYLGQWRVITDTTNFFAELIITPSGLYRLRQLDGAGGSWTGETDEQWVVRPYSRRNFLLVNFEGQNYHFVRDARPGLDRLFWPIDRISGSSGVFRIIKTQ